MQNSSEHNYEDGEWPHIVILMLTWAGPPDLDISQDRFEYTKRTISDLKQHFQYPNYSWHIADDASPREYQEKVLALLEGDEYTFTDTKRGWDVNNNLNIGMKTAFSRADIIAVWPDDRFLVYDLDVRSCVRLLMSHDDVCHIRINRKEPHLKATPIQRVGKKWWLLDKVSENCVHVLHLGPNIKHKRYIEVYGYTETGIWPPGRAEDRMDEHFRRSAGPNAVIPDEFWNKTMIPWGGKSTWERSQGGLREKAMPPPPKNILICGAGLAGSTIARLAADDGYIVQVVEKRPHIGGQCHDSKMKGTLVHQYGPHYFHTNSIKVMSFLSRFTDWTYYPCVVKVQVGEQLLPFPVNLTTMDMLNVPFPAETQRIDPENAEEAALAMMGKRVYQAIYEDYTEKQWGKKPSELSPSLIFRYPIRANREESYYYGYRFHDLLPAEGYTEMIRKMLDHPNIHVELNQEAKPPDCNVWTGPLDEYWGYKLGRLPYRSLSFEFQHQAKKRLPCLQVNYPDLSKLFTRKVEYDGFRVPSSNIVLVTEYPEAEGEPYYPIPTPENAALAKRYREMSAPNVIFCGRLAEYRYLYMEETIISAFSAFERVKCI